MRNTIYSLFGTRISWFLLHNSCSLFKRLLWQHCMLSVWCCLHWKCSFWGPTNEHDTEHDTKHFCYDHDNRSFSAICDHYHCWLGHYSQCRLHSSQWTDGCDRRKYNRRSLSFDVYLVADSDSGSRHNTYTIGNVMT